MAPESRDTVFMGKELTEIYAQYANM
jgi:hypothetical protein